LPLAAHPTGSAAKPCYTGAVSHLDFLDICAILLGIMYSIAKLDAQGRNSSNFPHVPEASFERWRLWTVSIYRLGAAGCFIRVLFHQGFMFWIGRHPIVIPPGGTPGMLPPAYMYPPMLLDMAFLAIVASTFIRANRARALRRELGIVLAPLTPAQASALAANDSDESNSENKDD
jgi:hypothetical protein